MEQNTGQLFGEGHRNAKLKDREVLEIRKKYKSLPGITYRALAEEYGVGITTIHLIVSRKRWKHLLHHPC